MTFLPIVERELRVAARLTSTYRNRALTAAAVALVALIMLLFGGVSPSPSHVGAAMFSTLSWMTLVLCVVEGLRKTADCLSRERREGTLGLLFLTDLKGYDVTLGKLAATSLTSFYGLLAMLPILALSLLLGGVTSGEYWRTALALASVLFFSLTAGMCVSAHSRVERRAVLGTLWLIVVWIVAPLLLQTSALASLSPGCAFFTAGDIQYRSRAADYWRSLWLTQAFGLVLLVWASLGVSRLGSDVGMRTARSGWGKHWSDWRFGDAAGRAKTRTLLLEINPASWLAGRNLSRRFRLWFLPTAVVAGGLTILLTTGSNSLLPLGVFFLLMNFVLKMRLASQACHCLAEARANNALEMLLCTPLKVSEMIDGQILALRRTFVVPVIFIMVAEALFFFAGVAGSPSNSEEEFAAAICFFGTFYLALFALDMAAVTWAGIWFGLSSNSETQATFRTIFFTLVLPCLFLILSCIGLPFVIGVPILAIVWARQRLNSDFRKLAAQRFDPASATSGSWFFTRTKYVRPPPKIRPPVAPPPRNSNP